jgi:metal-dependent amidase/aminoacylase/carboxypeptidase family protein
VADGDRLHGIVRHGGDASNVIPDRALLEYTVRSTTIDRARALEERVHRCFEAGALATGATVDIRPAAPPYSHIEADQDLTRFYGANATALGRTPFELPPGLPPGGASTDMGNVSLALPSIHPSFGIPGATVMPHHQDFAAACATPESDEAFLFPLRRHRPRLDRRRRRHDAARPRPPPPQDRLIR